LLLLIGATERQSSKIVSGAELVKMFRLRKLSFKLTNMEIDHETKISCHIGIISV
jgi:hypothetical protein